MARRIWLFIGAWLISLVAGAQVTEEFNGPFSSWANAKTRFGAVGNGKVDDTRKLQEGIDSLTNSTTSFNVGKKGYVVLYLPAGTYRITKSLVLRGKVGISIIGEDPANTIIKWDGTDSSTMFLANGSAYFKVARFTWDANKKKGVEAIGVHWKSMWNDGKSRSYAPLNIELSDHIFTGGLAVGIGGGTFKGSGTGNNDSEITIKRCTFNACTEAGIRITGFNALEYWVWYCRFIRCRIGIYCLNGNYHAYRSFFSGSTASDIHNNQGYYTSVRECFSLGSQAFSLDEGISCNPFKRIFQNNTIIDYKVQPILYYHLGCVSLINNTFGSQTKNTKVNVSLGSWCPGIYTVLSVNNRYQFDNPFVLDVPVKKIVRIGDSLFRKSSISAVAFEQSLPRPVKRTPRRVFEVPVGAGADEIQRIINKASLLKGTKPVVHFPLGVYYIEKTIVIPAGADLQLIGDGLLYASELLLMSNKPVAPIFRISGPSYITIRDLQVGIHTGNYNNDFTAFVFENIDQKGAGLILDQFHTSCNYSLYLDKLNYLQVLKNNSFFSEGNYISGGEVQMAGKGTFRVTCFGGQYARLTVGGNADFVSKDCWWEGQLRVPLDLAGDGNITIDGAKVAPRTADSLPTISIKRFKGRISLMNMYIQGGLSVDDDNKQLKLLGWNLHFYFKMMPLSFLNKKSNYQALFMGIHSQCFDAKNPGCKAVRSHKEEQVNVQDANLFIKDMVSQSSQHLPSYTPPFKKGASNIFISRVSVGSFNKGIEVLNR